MLRMLADPVRSVADFSFYREVPGKTVGATIGYIMYLGLLFALCACLWAFLHLRPRVDELTAWLGKEVPRLTLENGRLRSAAEGPVTVRHPETEELVIVIDTGRESAVTPAEMKEREALVYLTQGACFVFNKLNGEMKAYDFAAQKIEKPVEIGPEFYAMLGKSLVLVAYPALFLGTLFIFPLWKHAAAFIYSLVALLVNAFVTGGLEYPALYRLSVYAQTPVIVLQMLTIVLERRIPYFRLLAFLLVGVYLWQGIRQLRSAGEPPAVA